MNTQGRQEVMGGGRENFVSRLYQMLSAPEFQGIVAWSQTDEGPSFAIVDTAKFQERVLVNEFNHANFSSFVRQLNKYDFHKVKFRDPHSRVWEFRHPYFRPENRDKPYLIKRKQQSAGRRARRGDTSVRDQAEVAAKAAEMAARDAEDLVKDQVTDLEERVDRLEQNNMRILSALKMQQSLVERLLNAVNLPDPTDEADGGLSLDDQMLVDRYDINAGSKNLQALSSQNPLGLLRASASPGGFSAAGSPLSSHDTSAEPQQQPEHRKRTVTATSPYVLIAVDDDTGRDILTNFLLKFGCRVDSVDNGVDVVYHVETTQYDYIIIDSILRLLDGLSAVEVIRQTTATTPLLLLSDPMTAEDHETFMQRGVSAILYRPFSQSKLYSAMQQFRL